MDIRTDTNRQRLLWAGFFSIFAAGVGFSVRGGILGDWAREFGFTMAELGGITGGGLTGFGVIIILGSLIADRVGYGTLMVLAFLMHVVSAVLTLATGEIYAQFGREATYWNLFIAMFLFAIGNGIAEVVVNPLVATLFPNEKTHYLNVLHAGWPGGLIAGGLVSYFMNGGSLGGWQPFPEKVHWMVQMSMFLIPTLLYGALMLGQHFPRSEASQAGVSFGEMLLEFASPILLTLLLIHAMVGYVELGTDSWISRITGAIMGDPRRGLLLFVYTSGLMFALRFFAGPIEHLLSPLGLLCISGVLGAIGLTLLGSEEFMRLLGSENTVWMCVVAATVYACGKTFLWPTMLAVVSERFPKGGAITIGAVGGVGMLSAGLLGGPGIGFKQDYYATQELKQEAPQTYERYASDRENSFLGIKNKGLDNAKVGVLEDKGADLNRAVQVAEQTGAKNEAVKEQLRLAEWWKQAEPHAAEDAPPITEASLYGGRMALRLTAAVPATMAVLYLVLILYFKMRGGYKRVVIEPGSHAEREVPQHVTVPEDAAAAVRAGEPGHTGVRSGEPGPR